MIKYDGHEDESITYKKNGRVISRVSVKDLSDMPRISLCAMVDQSNPKLSNTLWIPMPHLGKGKYMQTTPIAMVRKSGKDITCLTKSGSRYDIGYDMKLKQILKDNNMDF